MLNDANWGVPTTMKQTMMWAGIVLAAVAATIGLIAIGDWLFARPPIAAAHNTEKGQVETDQIELEDWDEFSIS